MNISEFSGLRVFENVLATQLQPVRTHKKRRWQTAQQHALIQKKWTKRWGQRPAPCCYLITDPATGSRAVLAHPEIAKKLRAQIKTVDLKPWERIL